MHDSARASNQFLDLRDECQRNLDHRAAGGMVCGLIFGDGLLIGLILIMRNDHLDVLSIPTFGVTVGIGPRCCKR